MPKGINADGSPKKRPANAGKKPKPGAISKTFRLAADVIAILDEVPKQERTEYIEDAVRLKYKNFWSGF